MSKSESWNKNLHIITIEDLDFPDALSCLEHAQEVGIVTEQGQVRVVRVNERLMMVSPRANPERIGIKPARNISEAKALARQFLCCEEERGSEVEYGKQIR